LIEGFFQGATEEMKGAFHAIGRVGVAPGFREAGYGEAF
jgi:hypothetical protein